MDARLQQINAQLSAVERLVRNIWEEVVEFDFGPPDAEEVATVRCGAEMVARLLQKLEARLVTEPVEE